MAPTPAPPRKLHAIRGRLTPPAAYAAPEVYGRGAILRIVRCLPPIEQAYSLVRFSIMRPKLLSVMDLLLTDEGRILDVGCGFGLFAAYFGQTHPGRRIVGVDPNARRIGLARHVAARLGRGLARRWARHDLPSGLPGDGRLEGHPRILSPRGVSPR